MRRTSYIIALLIVLALPCAATNKTVKAGGGGDFTTIQACATAMVAGDSCTVFAGTYNETPSIPAGTAGNYKTITVNGSDVVSVLGFTVSSHTKIIGNCLTQQGTITTATCGFFIANTSNPRAGACVSGSGVTDVYVVNVVTFACGNTTAVSFTGTSTFVYMQGLTVSYPAITPGTISGCPNSSTCEGNGFLLIGNHFLIENGDFSHYTLGIDLNASQLFVRNNICHDQHETEASGNAHTDCWFSEPGVGGAVSTFNVFEGNTNSNGVGADAKTILAQNDGGSSACAGPSCFNLIERYNVISNMGGGLNSPSEVNSWPFIKFYNNTVVDGNAGGGSNGIINNLDAQTNSAQLNTIYYFASLGTNNTVYTCGSGCNRGYNLYFCGGSCPSTTFSGDTGNQTADPKFVNYTGVGNVANNYHLNSSSPAIAAGTYLTTVASGDTGSGTSLVVTDAAYFQDGYSLSNAFSTVHPDCISVTTVGNHVCITAVNYSTNTLTMATGFSRSVGDHVWLYSKSDGVQVLTGSAPDMGAFPFSTITYNARTDVIAQPYPSPIPCPAASCTSGGALLGAGYRFTPSDFNTPICRLTDYATGGSNNGWTTSNDSSSEGNDFSANKDLITLGKVGNTQHVFGLNVSTCTLTLDGSFSTPGTGSMFWSFLANSYVAYHAHRNGSNDLAIFSYDFTSCHASIATCSPTTTQLVDLGTTCSIAGLTGNSSATTGEGVSVSGDDQTFGVLGLSSPGQGASGSIYAITWNRTTGCTYWNTDTGHWFVNGVDQGAISIGDTFYIHNLRLGKGGNWLKIAMQGGTCQSTCASNWNYFWQVGTSTVEISLQSSSGCGHTAMGYSHFVNKCNDGSDVNDLLITPLSNINTNTSLPSAYPSPDRNNGGHVAWQANNSSDTNPFCAALETYGTFSVIYGWDNEIDCVATNGTGTVWRITHTYSSVSDFVPVNVSQDGSLLLFMSNWNGMVGCTNGTTNNCLSGPPIFVSGQMFGTNDFILPTSAQGNAGGYLFQNQGSVCTITTQTSWNQTVGGTTTDGTCSFTNINVPSGTPRTDVFLALPPITPGIAPATSIFAKVAKRGRFKEDHNENIARTIPVTATIPRCSCTGGISSCCAHVDGQFIH